MGLDSAYGIGSLKQGVCTSTTRPASPFEGQQIYETDTDLVKAYNGTSWVNVGATVGGLTLIKSQVVGSVVASVAVTNAFSATYDNYKIIYSGGVSVATQALKFSLTGMGSVVYGGFFGSSVGGAATNSGSNGTSFAPIAGYITTGLTLLNAEISMPFASMATLMSFLGARDGVGGFGMSFYEAADTTSYTGFTLTPTNWTLTGGTIYVYGYSKT